MKLGYIVFEDKTLLYCIIITVIIFCLIQLYIINSKNNTQNNNENFTTVIAKDNQSLINGSIAKINSLGNIIIRYSSNGSNKKNTMQDIINGISNNVNKTITSNIAAFKNNLTNNLVPIQNTINANTALITGLNTKLNTTISTLNSNISLAFPSYSIIAYNQTIAPPGWQICNGEKINYAGTNNGTTDISSPDLRSRFILSSGKNDSLTTRTIGQSGGEENNTITLNQMPKHDHQLQLDSGCFAGGGTDDRQVIDGTVGANGTYYGTSGMAVTGGNSPGLANSNFDKNSMLGTFQTTPHNNMPPYYVLLYIIKQPIKPT